MSQTFCKGDRVLTTQGPGNIVYCRMKAPDFTEVAVYSVFLDIKKDSIEGIKSYSGTIFPANQVFEFK